MRAVVLVGGAGTRLRPLTLTVPKQVLPIAGVPMIERVLGHLAGHGITEAVLSLGYLHGAFPALFPDGRCGPVKITYAIEPEPLDTAGAIRFAALEAGVDDRFLVVNGDNLTDLDVSAMAAFHAERGAAEATIALAHVGDPSAFGLVVTDEPEGRVTAFVEKPEKPAHGGAGGGGNVSAGTYILEPSVLERIPAGRRVSVEREVFPQLVADGTLFAYFSPEYWTDTGTPQQYLQAQLDLLSGRRPGPPAPGAVDHGGLVWWLGEAEVEGEVDGPALVGAGARIAKGSSVRGSVIGPGSRVEEGARVRGSVLLSGSIVGAGAEVSGSIVGEGVVVGEGAVLGGLTVVGAGAHIVAGCRLEGARVSGGT